MTTRLPRSKALFRSGLFVILASLGILDSSPSPASAQAETPAGNRITLNSDNVLLINGRKIFPIGFTLAPPPDSRAPNGKNGLEELADAGATFMRTGANGGVDWNDKTLAEEQKWEDAAARYGLYCWPFLRDLASINGQ